LWYPSQSWVVDYISLIYCYLTIWFDRNCSRYYLRGLSTCSLNVCQMSLLMERCLIFALETKM
jgi:hypothetical protein